MSPTRNGGKWSTEAWMDETLANAMERPHAHRGPIAEVGDSGCDGCGGIVRLSELDTWDGQRLCEACYPPECDCPAGSPCKDTTE